MEPLILKINFLLYQNILEGLIVASYQILVVFFVHFDFFKSPSQLRKKEDYVNFIFELLHFFLL